MHEDRLKRVRAYIANTPWAIAPGKLAAILELVSLRAAGEQLSTAEIAARLDAARPNRPAPVTPPGSVAVLTIDGAIVPKADLMTSISGGTSLESFTQELRAAAADPNVAAIVLNIDSPGGSVDLVPETAAEVRAAAKRKPVVAVANTQADSAAYWIASQATEIAASPSAEVGSIGVIAAHQDLTAMQEKAGIKTTLITAGAHKGELSPFAPLSDEARANVQHRVDQTYSMFIGDVARGRGITPQQVEENYGQGRALSAQDALRAGMVDRIETLDQTLARLVGGTPTTRRANANEDDQPQLAAADATENTPIETTLGQTLALASDPFQTAGNVRLEIAEHLTDHLITGLSPTGDTDSRATAVTPTPRMEENVKTIDQLVARQDEITARQKELDAEYVGRLMDGDAKTEFDALESEFAENKAIIEDDKRRKAMIEAKAASDLSTQTGVGIPKGVTVTTTSARRIPENIYALDEYRARAASMEELSELYQDGALRAIEAASFPHPRANQEDAQAAIERLVRNADSRDGAIARRILATGNPTYERAFGKLVTGQPLNGLEQQALAMYGLSIGTPSDGGYAIPFTLDPTVVPTSNGAVNPWRALGNVKQITGNQWKGVASDGVTVSFDGEAAEVDEDSPVLAQPVVYAEKAQVFVRYSIEVEGDWPTMRGELAVMIQDAKDAKEAEMFTTGAGHGSDQPHGIITALGASSDVETDDPTLALSDVDKLDEDLPPRFEPNAVFVANKAFYAAVRKLAGQTFDIWMPLADGIAKREAGNTGRTLAGYPAWRSSEMSSSIASASEKIALLGDVGRYFVIADRVGMSLEVVPHLMGENNRPTGERGLYGYFRTGSDILSTNAFRLLKVAAT